jgi:hypothetical protein
MRADDHVLAAVSLSLERRRLLRLTTVNGG